jgi:uncharacterized membrane protein YkvA (DUF1232 family)
MLETVKRWARPIKRDVVVHYIAARDRRVPWYAKAIAALVAAYALSPIDFIADFIPVLGYLDDLIVVTAGILLAVRLIPPDVLMDLRAQAARQSDRPRSYAAAAAIASIRVVIAGIAIWWLCRASRST